MIHFCNDNNSQRAESLYDTCARLRALCIKHCNNTQPNPVMHYMSRSAPHSPCMHTHARVRTHQKPPPHPHPLHKPQAVYVRRRGRRHSRSGVVPTAEVAVTVGRESAEAAAGDDRWVHPDRKLDGWLLPGMDRQIVSLDITKLRTTLKCVWNKQEKGQVAHYSFSETLFFLPVVRIKCK